MKNTQSDSSIVVGFDPGRLKCGLALMTTSRQLISHEVVPSEEALNRLQSLHRQYNFNLLVMGDQTTSKTWKKQITSVLPDTVKVVLVDERYSSLEARDRYWELYPPTGLTNLIPKGMRQPPRPVDDFVAIVLIERYLNSH